jgi:hypothetical protein
MVHFLRLSSKAAQRKPVAVLVSTKAALLTDDDIFETSSGNFSVGLPRHGGIFSNAETPK